MTVPCDRMIEITSLGVQRICEVRALHMQTEEEEGLCVQSQVLAARPTTLFLLKQRLRKACGHTPWASCFLVAAESLMLQFITKCHMCSAGNTISCVEASLCLGRCKIIL